MPVYCPAHRTFNSSALLRSQQQNYTDGSYGVLSPSFVLSCMWLNSEHRVFFTGILEYAFVKMRFFSMIYCELVGTGYFAEPTHLYLYQ